MTPRHPVNIRISPRTTTLILTLSLFPALAHTQEPSSQRHVADAERLVQQLDLSNTNYEHGVGSITWTGTVASHTDCSGFIDQILMKR
ncbi:MAG TPA: hypothetical protein VK636_19715 [Gemmatimonadaceae bacterium]|nr:hypothetical protein [Gemmatimonadaceae bacterium]